MRGNGGREKIIYGLLSLACFCLLLGLTGRELLREPERKDVSVVLFGDSILGECRDETSVGCKLQELAGVQVYNGAMGGTSFGYLDRGMRLGHTKDCMSMASLSASVRAGDYSVQRSARIRESYTEYFPETIQGLSQIDFAYVETVFIQYGMNDYHGGSPLVNEEDAYDEYTFTGAIRRSVRNLRTAYPHLRIILVTPTYSWYLPRELTCEEYNPGGGILERYVEAEISLAAELGVEIVDVYHDFYPHESWEDWEIYTRDGLHPNEAGRELLAGTLAACLE